MQLTDEELQQIEEFAGLLFTPEQIAVLMDLPEADLNTAIRSPGHVAYLAYQKGYLMASATLRRSIIKLASQGSTPAQKMMLDLLQEIKRELVA